MVVLHELGHVIDFTCSSTTTLMRGSTPASRVGECGGRCDGAGACTAIPERFADTFAKWALRGRFSLAGSGYGDPDAAVAGGLGHAARRPGARARHALQLNV